MPARAEQRNGAARCCSWQIYIDHCPYRRAYALDPLNGQAAVKIANLQQTLRERAEAARAPPPIEALREQARQQMQPPLLDPASDAPLTVSFAEASLRAIIDFLGEASGINVTYDEGFVDATYSVTLTGLAFEEALTRILAANGAFHAVVNPTTIVVAPDTPAARAAYTPQVIRTFYVSHADVEELAGLLTAVVGGIQASSPPQFFANTAANSITVRATAPVAGIVERVIAANDKPPVEIVIDIEILEVNRERAKRYGLDLSQYSVTTTFSPESAPAAAPASDEASGEAPAFNLNTITRGVSFADFYTAVPAAVINFLEQDSQTRLVAQPQLRGQEGTELTLNLGQEIPVPTTAFTPLAAGGASFNPLTSFHYRAGGGDPEHDAAGDLRERDRARPRSGEQHPGAADLGGGPVAADVRDAQRGDAAAAARRRVEPAGGAAAAGGAAVAEGVSGAAAPADSQAALRARRAGDAGCAPRRWLRPDRLRSRV